MHRTVLLLLAGLIALSFSQSGWWSLSGKVVDAEEGNGLNAVEVALVGAGLKTTTAKNGTWNLAAGVGVRPGPSRNLARENSLRVVEGRLSLRLDGLDIQGRRREALALPVPAAARSLEAVSDTLVYSREGFVTRRVPLSSSTVVGMIDSLRRIRYEGWVDSSHSNGFKPDTLDAFADTVRQFTFKFAKPAWDSMMKAMADSCGKFGGGQVHCNGAGLDFIENGATIWVPADLYADGQVWKNIAIRLKGNGSLRTAWTKGNYTLPFRVNMDKFEDTYPEIKNQRFHGFKKLSFYTSDQDSSSIRASMASEIFRESGVPCPISVPAHLFLDRGDGQVLDLGLYEMTEVPDSPFLNRRFGNDTGHLYKPESNLSKFTQSEWFDEDLETDYADAKELIAAINASNRTSDSAAWHRSLEKVLDVDGFLNWLAVNTAIYNWDAYGQLAHNYYLYNDAGRFRWIAYDIAFSFNFDVNLMSHTSIWYDGGGGFGGFGGGFPLIKNLLADKSYCERYRSHMERAISINGPAGVASYQAKLERFMALVADSPLATRHAEATRDVMTTRKAEIEKSLAAKTCPIK